MRKETKYDKIVIVDDNTFTVLNKSFDNGSFKGLCGSTFEIVSKATFDDTIEPYVNDKEELLCYMADNFGELTSEIIRSADNSEEGLKQLFFDLSYEEQWDMFREELDLSEEEAYIFNCIGGGRCFGKDSIFTHNKHLQYLINEFES